VAFMPPVWPIHHWPGPRSDYSRRRESFAHSFLFHGPWPRASGDAQDSALSYYGGAYFHKNVGIDRATGGPVGYGYSGSPSEHNRSIQQVTAGFSRTFWRDPAYGALQLMTQYSYLFRQPWYMAPAQPSEANLNMLYLNLRYAFPGAPPSAR
jgi:hypothetical protein